MMQLAMLIDGKKFMWDGTEYQQETEARDAVKTYTKDGFDARMIKEEGKFYVFTRRPVAQVTTEGASTTAQ